MAAKKTRKRNPKKYTQKDMDNVESTSAQSATLHWFFHVVVGLFLLATIGHHYTPMHTVCPTDYELKDVFDEEYAENEEGYTYRVFSITKCVSRFEGLKDPHVEPLVEENWVKKITYLLLGYVGYIFMIAAIDGAIKNP